MSRKLCEIYKEKIEDGLVDVKFIYKSTDQTLSNDTLELQEDLLKLENAISKGDFEILDFNDIK